MPPGGGAHVADPGLRRVPVVVDVVIVEHHRRTDRRHQPADRRIAPGLLVEHRVLVDVEHLLAGGATRVTPRANFRHGLRRDLVGVDLVAEQQQQPRPLRLGLVAHPQRQRVQRVDADALRMLVDVEDVRAGVWPGDSARPPDDFAPPPIAGASGSGSRETGSPVRATGARRRDGPRTRCSTRAPGRAGRRARSGARRR